MKSKLSTWPSRAVKVRCKINYVPRPKIRDLSKATEEERWAGSFMATCGRTRDVRYTGIRKILRYPIKSDDIITGMYHRL